MIMVQPELFQVNVEYNEMQIKIIKNIDYENNTKIKPTIYFSINSSMW